MRLKKQRDDVKWLKTWNAGDIYAVRDSIARRYLNLIRVVEYWFTEMEADCAEFMPKELRVLKDSEGK